MSNLTIYTDGGSRGNPGRAAGAFVIFDQQGSKIFAGAKFISNATNNIAEYTGLLSAVEAAIRLEAESISIFSDSELMVKQLSGQYKVKNEGIRQIYQQIVSLLGRFESWQITHVRRDKNKDADALANRAMDIGTDITEDCRNPAGQGNSKKLRLAILLSGSGRTLDNIVEHIRSGYLNAQIVQVISSRSDVAGVSKATKYGFALEIIRKKDFSDIDSFSRQIKNILLSVKADLVIQAGWLCLWKIPSEYENKVMNIHPALLPSFGGKGMWGHYVHEAVLRKGCKVSGCTVHFCTNEYDKGAIIVQRTCTVSEDDTPDTLAARVFETECAAYPEAIKLFSQGRVAVRADRTFIA